MKRKIISLICALSLIICSCVVCSSALSDAGSCGDGVTWSFSSDDGTLRISGGGRMDNYISAGKAPWSKYSSDIMSLEIDGGVEYIGSNAFASLSSLSQVSAGESLKEIGAGAFDGTAWLDNSTDEFVSLNGILICYNGAQSLVALPESITGISAGAFYGNDDITEIKSEYSLDIISDSAFADCVNLKTASFNSLKQLKDYVFSGCIELSSINLSDDVIYIGASCFSDTAWMLASGDDLVTVSNILVKYQGEGGIVNIPDSIKGIADAFEDNLSVESVKIPQSAAFIGKNAFSGCKSLNSVVFGDGIKKIEKGAFYDCESLTEVFLPLALTEIGNNAFENCISLLTVKFSDSLKKIGNYSFSSCSSLQTVVLPNTVESVGDYAFLNFTSLNSLYSGANSTSYGMRSVGYIITSTGISVNSGMVVYGKSNSSLYNYCIDNGLDFNPYTCEHSYSSSSVMPTCDCFGYTESVCSNCGYVLIENITEPTEHDFSDWYVTENGVYCRTCSECKQSENLPILYGDLNNDAKSDGEDAVIAQAMMNNLLSLSQAADCNRNGGIDESDIELIVMSGLFLGEIEQGY